MPTVLRDNQHELCVGDDTETPLLRFGTLETEYLTTDYPTIEDGDARTGDVDRVREDGVMFGEDYLPAKTATFNVAALTDRSDDPHSAGSFALARFEAAWKNPALRAGVGSYGVLRSRMAGVTRRAYGRPRRYGDTPTSTTTKGWTSLVATFDVPDGTWYDDVEKSQSCRLVPPSEGGVVAPVIAPVVTTPASEGAVQPLIIGGMSATWIAVTFHAVSGTVRDPSVRIGDWTIGLTGTIPAGMDVTVDPRPWTRGVRRSDGASQSGKLAYTTPPLRLLRLPRGTYSAVYQAADATGSSWCEVTWREAFPRWGVNAAT